ncbi:hypothetical protein J1N51_07815 [Psychrosphaera ytuae]|uniref:GP-PDE domain-containing protein n=1 Tax=Psychrosphaera ytuae TaxID=2820710 RepID=A0A975D997_9GAMM|nr:glycerophosphodiester phosphodiesterase family protein [Psychrosphaera ytuae]QTH62688.1 hypothetical protein J1N51_07815 [Psychrosphaera ytuae]
MLIFAHRGESALHPENSKVALSHCNDEGMDGLEIDLFETESDFVVFHDRWLTRLLNIDKKVSDLTEYDLDAIKGNDGESIPNLAWLIEYCAPYKFTLNIEIKGLKSVTRFEQALMSLCEKFSFDRRRLLISSFNHRYLQTISKHLPDLKLGLLLAINPIDISTLLNDFPIYSVHLDMDCIDESIINDIHEQNKKVFVFTVDHADEISWLFRAGVDGIFANHPRQAHNIVNQLKLG